MTIPRSRHLHRSQCQKLWLNCRRVSAIVGIFVLLSQTVLADSVPISNVVQTIDPSQGLVELRVNTLAQDPVSADGKESVNGETHKTKSSDSKSTSSLLGVEVSPETQQLGVEVVGDAIVEGTVCDCGEILVPGGFPKWPLLFLAAIPLIFIHHCDDCDTDCVICNNIVTPTPTPTPPNNSVPEPGTLLLFGSGLLAFGAGLRRRYAKSRLATENQTDE